MEQNMDQQPNENQKQTDNSRQMYNGAQETLPNSTAVLVLGILSIVTFCCYGLVGIILGIISIALSGSARRLYRENPSKYSLSSYNNMNAGRICAIIGLCLSGLVIIYGIIIIAIYGIALSALFSSMPWNTFHNF